MPWRINEAFTMQSTVSNWHFLRIFTFLHDFTLFIGSFLQLKELLFLCDIADTIPVKFGNKCDSHAVRVLGDNHYKRLLCVKVDVESYRTLTAQWLWVPSLGQNLQPLTGNGDVSVLVKNSRVGRLTPNKQTNK